MSIENARNNGIIISGRNSKLMAENNAKKINLREVKASDIKNPELKAALAELKKERTQENEQKMIRQLEKARLLVPVSIKGTSAKNMQISFVLVHTNDGKTFFPAFTDEEESKKLQRPEASKGQFIVRTVLEFAPFLSDARNQAEGVVIDPFNSNIVLPKKLVISLAQAHQQARENEKALASGKIPAGMQVTFMEPRIYPTALVNAVHDEAEKLPEVQQVFFKQMVAGAAISFALFVKCDEDKLSEETMNALREAAVPHAKGVDVTVLKWTKAYDEKVLKDSVPLYDRELGL